MKKLIVTIVLLSLILSMPIPSLAKAKMDVVDENGILLEEKAEDLTLNEAGTTALLFIAQNFNNCENWNLNTSISSIKPLYDLHSEISGYCFELRDGDIDAGYVVISVDMDKSFVQEYSYDGKPTYYSEDESYIDEKVVFIDPLHYYIDKGGELYKIKEKGIKADKVEIEKYITEKNKADKAKTKATNKYLRDLLKKNGTIDFDLWFSLSGYDGQYAPGSYVVTNVYSYVVDRYGSYSASSADYVTGIQGYLQSSFGDDNDCSVMSIATIAKYYSSLSSYSMIPNDIDDIYDDVVGFAITRGYDPDDGTPINVIDNIVEDSFSEWGYSFDGINDYYWSFNEFKSEIGNDNPFVFTLAGGTYNAHSIAVYGYRTFTVGSYEAEFLMVYDNWVTNTRYIDYDVLDTGAFGTITKIHQ